MRVRKECGPTVTADISTGIWIRLCADLSMTPNLFLSFFYHQMILWLFTEEKNKADFTSTSLTLDILTDSMLLIIIFEDKISSLNCRITWPFLKLKLTVSQSRKKRSERLKLRSFLLLLCGVSLLLHRKLPVKNPSDRGVPLVTFLSIKDRRKEPNRPLMQLLLLSHSSGAWAPAATFKRCLFCAEVFHPSAATHIGLNVLACSLPRQAQVGTARAACLGRDEGLAHWQ